jgi:hypothetical protein
VSNSTFKRQAYGNFGLTREEKLERRMANMAEILRAAPRSAASVVARIVGPAMPQPKHDYVRSPALMRAYRLIPCQHCGAEDGTVCGAHANWADFGKGRGIKADDNRCASLCAACHSMLDSGSILGRAERMAMWFTAHVKTVNELVRRGLWPSAVPVPDLRWERIA